MTKFTKILATVAMLWLVTVYATPLMAQQDYDFKVGQLYYKITDTAKREVAVVREQSNYPYNYNKPTGAITIPATVANGGNTYSVTSIGASAFYNCSGLTSIDIPNSVTSIGGVAFYDCSGLTSITIPNSVTSIEQSTFSRCSGLTSINIPNSVTSIEQSAFSGCRGLTSINIPSGVTSIEYETFSGCSGLTSINIPNSVTSIGGSAFFGCSGLTSINIPNSVTSIGGSAFEGCSGLTSINIPSSVMFIGKDAFSGCSGLTSITIPSGITKIEGGTFAGCSGLTSINIPSSVTSIGNWAFAGCTGLTAVAVGWQTPLRVDQSVFDGVTLGRVKLIVPFGKKNVYKTAHTWKNFNPIVEVEPITYIVTYSQSTGGTFKIKNGTQEVASGSVVNNGTVLTVEATPAQGYKLDSIRVNGVRISGLSFTVTDNTNIEVFFGKQSYTVTYNSNMYSGKIEVTRGSEIVASGSSVEYGTQLMVRAIPNHGFEVKSLTINDQAIVNNFVFSISEAVEIKAVFAPATTALDEAATEPLTLYPNPVAEVLYLSATARTIRIYDMYGTEVAHAADTDRVVVSHLPAGVYTVRADGMVAKMIKR